MNIKNSSWLSVRQIPSCCVQYTTLNRIVKKNMSEWAFLPCPDSGGKIVVKTKWGQPVNEKNPTISNVKSLDLNGPSGENRTHGLLNPIVLLSKTQWTLRYHLYAVSSNFKIILSFCFVRCQDVLFLLWSNCGQPTLTNDHSPLLNYMAQFRFSKIEIALFVCTNYL